MNKQEMIEKIKGEKILGGINSYGLGYNEALDEAIYIVKQLDEPEKPVLNQAEAKWLEALKESFPKREHWLYHISRYGWGHQLEFNYHGDPFTLSYKHCRGKGQDSIRRRLVDAILYDYEVEKEKLYTVELPNPNGDTSFVLCKDDYNKVGIDCFCSNNWKDLEGVQLTEAEIKEDYEWAWQFAKGVEE